MHNQSWPDAERSDVREVAALVLFQLLIFEWTVAKMDGPVVTISNVARSCGIRSFVRWLKR